MNDTKIYLKDLKFLPGKEKDNVNDVGDASDYLVLTDLSFFKELVDFLNKNRETEIEGLLNFIKLYAKGCENVERQNDFIATGVGLLQLFIQKNWIGPDIALNNQLEQISNSLNKENILKYLVVDGENVIPVVEIPDFLFISKTIFENAYSSFNMLQFVKIWYLRCLFIHQQVLEELSTLLFNKINEVIGELEEDLNALPHNVIVNCHLEFARIYLFYQNIQKSRVEVLNGTQLSGLEISLSGALGKRTKFQQHDLAQLILKVGLENGETVGESPIQISYSTQPRDVKLDDDVRLDKIKYSDSSQNKYPDLTGLQQAVILGNLFQTQKSQPKDSLADEELQPLINCILDQPKIWSIRMTTLLLRSKLEANHKRTVERSLMQVQVLMDCFKEMEISFEERFTYFFISYMPPKWEIKSMLANILISIGSIKSALEIYESLYDWENVIFCYNALQLRHKAQEIIEQELKKDPSPKLWCLLGDATDDISCYETAWELSNKRSARAQRHWGYYYYLRRNYGDCIEHFQKSLEINSLQKELWYRLGYAALMEEKWEISAGAYRRYCVLDPECFEAWNNLARCYCELKQKYRAWRALQEALKVDYSKWKVWDNYMLVSSDVKAFDEVVKSYHEILNLKGKHLDLPVLNALVSGFKTLEKEEAEGETGNIDKNKFRSKLLELFGRLTSQIINDGELWFLYSEIVDENSSENLVKKHQLLMKAHRSAINKPDWDQKLENCNKIIYVLSKMVEVGLKTENPNVLMSCKLAASGALAKIKKSYPDAGFCEELEQNLEKLDKILDS